MQKKNIICKCGNTKAVRKKVLKGITKEEYWVCNKCQKIASKF